MLSQSNKVILGRVEYHKVQPEYHVLVNKLVRNYIYKVIRFDKVL